MENDRLADLEKILTLWYKKQALYEYELSITASTEKKFELGQKIQECEVNIERLQNLIDPERGDEIKNLTIDNLETPIKELKENLQSQIKELKQSYQAQIQQLQEQLQQQQESASQQTETIPLRRSRIIIRWSVPIISFLTLTIIVAIGFIKENYIAKQNLYKLSGLSEIHKKEERIFQDFAPRNQESNNVNVVSWLWADAFRGASIKAVVVNSTDNTEDKYPNYLRVTFDNRNEGFPPNVAIRSKREKGLLVAPNFNSLELKLRIPKSQEDLDQENHIDKLIIAFRVVDRYLTHWDYQHPPGHYIITEVESDKDWVKYYIDISPKSMKKWSIFKADGNYTYPKQSPDFSIITSVVIVVGGEGENKPYGGYGTVDIADIRLTNHDFKE